MQRGPPTKPGQLPLTLLSSGLWRQRPIRRILELSGFHPTLSPSAPSFGIWGRGATSRRIMRLAQSLGRSVITLEEPFLRGPQPGRLDRRAPLGLLIDDLGVHYDAASPSRLETLLAEHPLSDEKLLADAANGLQRMQDLGLGKFAVPDPQADPPLSNYVLVVDQVAGDASLRASGAGPAEMLAMLQTARQENPVTPILIASHPETLGGARAGLLSGLDLPKGCQRLEMPVSCWRLLAHARAVYTLSSGLGAEAIWAGHRPHVFGTPYYAGWGLTEDRAEKPLPRRTRQLRPEQLFAAAMLLAPNWYDPFRDELTDFDTALDIAEAQSRAWQEDRRGYACYGMALWKRRHMNQIFGGRLSFHQDPAKAVQKAQKKQQPILAWANRARDLIGSPAQVIRVEDGFLRSQGLGAQLVPPLSLIADRTGIYYDPSRPSELESRIINSPNLPDYALKRADRLIAQICRSNLTKYGSPPRFSQQLEAGHRILVVGQVEDDASVTLGAGGPVRNNAQLLQAARDAHPNGLILYKPHPDVEAGLRPGILPPDAARLANRVLTGWSAAEALEIADELWTLSSTMGFEAILRDIPVTCLGAPFYAGWGLTQDLGPIPSRRRRDLGISRSGLAHAALIAAPRYFDPKTGEICPPEIALLRLEQGGYIRQNRLLRSMRKLQGLWISVFPRRP